MDITLWLQLQPDAVVKEIDRLHPNHIMLGIVFLDAILENDFGDMRWLSTIGGGGGAITEKKERMINDYLMAHGSNQKFLIGYGMTETVATSCAQLKNAWKEGSVGIPLPMVIVKTIDKDSKELEIRKTGEICVSTPNMMLEYFKNPEETEKIIYCDEQGNRWLKTGDLGYIDEDGFIVFQGRIKRIYYSRLKDGTIMRLFPQRIEEFLESQKQVERCGVVVKEDDIRVATATAFITVNSIEADGELLAKLKILLHNELPEHMQPAAIHILDTMPMTPSGKIDYRALEALAGE